MVYADNVGESISEEENLFAFRQEFILRTTETISNTRNHKVD